MIHFELHAPNGFVKAIREKGFDVLMGANSSEFSKRLANRENIVDYYLEMIEKQVLPHMPEGTCIYLVIDSNANVPEEKTYG